MKKKIFAILALVLVLAMESVTVFATESVTSRTEEVSGNNDSDDDDTDTTPTTTTTTTTTNQAVAGPDNGLFLYGDAGSGETSETLDEVDAEELIKDVELEFNEEEGTFEDTKKGMVFEDNKESNEITLIKTPYKDMDKWNLWLDEEKDHHKEGFTPKEKAVVTGAVEFAHDLGTKAGANMLVAYSVNAEGAEDRYGNPTTEVSFKSNNMKFQQDYCTILHYGEDGQIHNLYANVSPDGYTVTAAEKSISYSPFILLVFDSPVPGLTTRIDYADSTVKNETVVGAVSPKTAEAEPYKMLALFALITIAGAAIFARKLAD
jgi:hypothetical protein